MPVPGREPVPIMPTPAQQPVQSSKITAMPEQTSTGGQGRGGIGKKLLIIGAVIILAGAGYAAAAYFTKLWPFQTSGFIDKQLVFAGLFGKIQEINSATYASTLSVKADAREAGATPLTLSSFPEFQAEEQMYERDANRFRDVNRIQGELRTYRDRYSSYPARLADIAALGMLSVAEYTYVPDTPRQQYALTVTFETDEALKAAQLTGNKNATSTTGKTVTFTAGSGTYFYFSAKPPRPNWVSFFEQGEATNYFDFLPADFAVQVNVGGTSQRNADAKADASFTLGGGVAFGDFTAAANVEVRKKGDVWYGIITKFPSLFFMDLASIKNTWVQITREDLLSYGQLPEIASFVGDKQEKNRNALEQIQTIFKSMGDEKVLVPDFSLPDEVVAEVPMYAYAVSYDENRVVGWYEKLSGELKNKYGDDALIKLDETSLKYMKTASFQQFLSYIKNNTVFKILVDKKTGYPSQFSYRFRLVPAANVAKFKDKQVTVEVVTNLTDVNQPVVVEAPKDFMTFEEAQVALTGVTPELYRFNTQVSRIAAIRQALSYYYNYTGIYPATLDDLTKKRGEVTKKTTFMRSLWNGYIAFGDSVQKLFGLRKAQAQVSLDFPNSFDNYWDLHPEIPFIVSVPKDIYSGNPYEYAQSGTGDYTLRYTMHLPKRITNDDPESARARSGPDMDNVLLYVEGQNTANAKTLSVEGSASLKVDTDSDGLPDTAEAYYGSDARAADTDHDGYSDLEEAKNGYDPAGPGQLPYNDRWSSQLQPPTVQQPNASTYTPPIPTESNALKIRAVTTSDHIRGTQSAQVTLIQYSDFQCPFCTRFKTTLDQVLKDYAGKVRLVYRHFPLRSIHPLAQKAAEASECAADQGKFWDMHDELFALNDGGSLTLDAIKKTAGDLKLDTTKFNACLDGGTKAAIVEVDYQDGLAGGVNGTPATFINGQYVAGALPYEQIKMVIDQQLEL